MMMSSQYAQDMREDHFILQGRTWSLHSLLMENTMNQDRDAIAFHKQIIYMNAKSSHTIVSISR